MTRSRWIVVLGPPLFIVAAGSAVMAAPSPRLTAAGPPRVVAATRPQVVAAGPLKLPSFASCPGSDGDDLDRRAGNGADQAIGTWWRESPEIDPSGALTGWRLVGGSGGSSEPILDRQLTPASLVSGPDHGRLVVASDAAGRSSVQVLDLVRACSRSIDVGESIARRAIADPSGDGLLVHLLDRQTRRDLGIWRFTGRGPKSQVLAALSADDLQRAGMARVWSTDLSSSVDGSTLAIQSCDPERCLTRVVDLTTRRVSFVLGDQGALVGLAGSRLITMASCPGLPCSVLSWDPLDGGARTIALGALSGAVTADGRVVVAIGDPDGTAHALTTDPFGQGARQLGALGGASLAATGLESRSGVETPPRSVGLIDRAGNPGTMDVGPGAEAGANPHEEVEP